MLHVEDKTLTLADGRTLAYADNGNTSSTTVVLYLHGAFSVGVASHPPPVLLEKNVHYVAPSLPGWGQSSPVPNPLSYSTTLAKDLHTLLTFLHPNNNIAKLYVCAHSFGTLPAQMLCEAPYNLFPLGSRIAALILLAPHSPPHRHAAYAKCMTWQGYFMAGPPARYIPFSLLGRLVKAALASTFKTTSSAEAFARAELFDAMGNEEREAFVRWREEHDLKEGQYEQEVSKTLVRSVARTWQGFLDMPTIYHFGWSSDVVPVQDTKFPVLVVTSTDDRSAPDAMAKWLADYYPSSKLKILVGGHSVSLFHLQEIWKEVLDWVA